MLKRISPAEVTLGMYVHSLQGAWLSHPFWRTRFLIRDADQIAALRQSGVSSVVIDLERSRLPKNRAGGRRSSAAVQSRPRAAERLAEDRRFAAKITTEARRVMKTVFDGARQGEMTSPAEIETVLKSIAEALDRNRPMLFDVLRLRGRDEYTYYHSVSVGALMVNFAQELRLDEDQVRLMGIAGLFHDIGKTQVSTEILNKPGKLTDEEFDEIREHPGRGHAMLQRLSEVPPIALEVCLHHHEKMDGTGYPHGLAGDAISLAARMGAICDVYDALTTARAYKSASSPVAAITMMAGWKGHFDPELLFVFMKSIRVFPVGLLLRLRNDQLAVVRDNGRRASRARLTCFYDIPTGCLVPPRDIYLADVVGDDVIAERASPDDYGLIGWPELRTMLLEGRDPSGPIGRS
ncbi:HD-GYP domain-containing protein [Sphingomonas sp. CJ20]